MKEAEKEARRLIQRFWGSPLKFDRPFTEENYIGADDAREGALICVDEIILALEDYAGVPVGYGYWSKVKQAINKL